MKYLKYTIAFFAPFIVMYLLISFVTLSFDVTQWHQDFRFLLACFGPILSTITVFLVPDLDRD